MNDLTIYCMSIHPKNLNTIKELNYIPVGLYNENFSNEWMRDNTGDNISKKNPYYGEYTFYYWYWKNLLKHKKNNEWVGFCHYREYWGNDLNKNSKELKDLVLQKIYPEWSNYDAIIGKPIFVGGTKLIKVIKYGKKAIFNNPRAIFFKKGRTIRWQFDMFHGVGNLDKAIDLLPENDREEFRQFTRNETSFARGNMFITKSSKIMDDYFNYIFKWLLKCEDIFGFNLIGHGQIRMYTFLAERFLPFWFKKYTNYLEWPVIFYDINKS
tara:strand:+ start:237 stop:1040 length:804 start_codon:yes stop_codon:yes gene_type:complete